tara:strand:+ start:46 stop:372 length:327 start_codon:yes stop_codon:yes gene_type:complete
MSKRSSRSNSIDSDNSSKMSVDSRSYSFDSLSSNSGKIRTSSFEIKDVSNANAKERLFIIPIKNNTKHVRREREQNLEKVIAKSPNIQNVVKYLHIFEQQRREAKTYE